MEKMMVSPSGALEYLLWFEIQKIMREILNLGEFVVRPNHIHGNFILNGNGENTWLTGEQYDNRRNIMPGPFRMRFSLLDTPPPTTYFPTPSERLPNGLVHYHPQ